MNQFFVDKSEFELKFGDQDKWRTCSDELEVHWYRGLGAREKAHKPRQMSPVAFSYSGTDRLQPDARPHMARRLEMPF